MCSFETTSRESCCIQISPTTRVVLSTLCDLSVSVPSCMPSPTLPWSRLVFHRAQRVLLLAGRAPVPWKDMVWYIIRYNVLGVPDSIIVYVDNVDFWHLFFRDWHQTHRPFHLQTDQNMRKNAIPVAFIMETVASEMHLCGRLSHHPKSKPARSTSVMNLFLV